MNLVEMKTATITSKGQISIPIEMRKHESFKVGAKIAILTFEDHVELRPMNQISEKLYGAIASEKSLAKEWNTKKEDKAWKNL
jgi:bifunctional DNA-binding transcriptional regulator/antitoxin component of YhaV-PrlF toxin-antitoxin module